jgi:hypothetical protein
MRLLILLSIGYSLTTLGQVVLSSSATEAITTTVLMTSWTRMGAGLFPTLMALSHLNFGSCLSSVLCVSWITAGLRADCFLVGHLDTPF